MTVLTETQHAGGFLVHDGLRGHMNRKQAVLNSGQTAVKTGTVLGQLLSAAAAVAAAGNTGNGAVTISAAIGPATVIGIYKLICVAAASNAGTFNFHAPDGTLIRQITVAGGATPSDHLTITIADSTDFIVGDSFTIAVTGGDYEALTVAGTTGVQIAAAILWEARDAASADKPCTVVFGPCVVETSELVWPSGISDANKAIAVSQLARAGMQFR